MTAVTRLYAWLSGDRRWEPIDADDAPAGLSASTALDNWLARTDDNELPDVPNKRDFFETPYDQFADRRGEAFTILRVIDTPDESHDAEVLPMYEIEFESDGLVVEAWPEEVLTSNGTYRATIEAAGVVIDEAIQDLGSGDQTSD